MSDVWKRVRKRYNMTISSFYNDCNFSISLAFLRLIDDFSSRCHLIKISERAHKKKEDWILNYLEKSIGKTIEKYKYGRNIGEKTEKAPIWVCWWTGVENAPAIITKCIHSIQQNANGHPVIILTKDNYQRYLDVPEYIYGKMNSGKMGLAHFADYLRVSLIYKYGGLWLDATIYCAEVIPEWYFELPFFTCRSEYQNSRYLSHYQWVTFCLGGWKGNIFYAFIKEALETYWMQNNYAIDYLFFDDIIYLAKKHIKAIRELMDAVPLNTPHRDDLQAAFNACLPADAFSSVIFEDTPIYKLSWRETYSEYTPDGKQSIYGFFLSERKT